MSVRCEDTVKRRMAPSRGHTHSRPRSSGRCVFITASLVFAASCVGVVRWLRSPVGLEEVERAGVAGLLLSSTVAWRPEASLALNSQRGAPQLSAGVAWSAQFSGGGNGGDVAAAWRGARGLATCAVRGFTAAAAAAAVGLRRATSTEIASGAVPGVRIALTATLDGASPDFDAALVAPPSMLLPTLAALCGAPPAYDASFQYELRPSNCGAAGGASPPPPSFAAPWCLRPSDAATVLAIDCGWVESFVQDDWRGPVWRVISGSVLTLNASTGGTVLADAETRDGRPAALWPRGGAPPAGGAPAVRVVEHAVLATAGPLRCAWCPGHFFNEALPVLLLLDALLPATVPLLWPAGDVPEAAARALRRAGVLSPRRRVLLEPREPTLHHVQRLYAFRDTGAIATSWLAQRFAARVLQRAVAAPALTAAAAATAGYAPAAADPPPAVMAVVLLREGASTRRLTNAPAVVAAIRAAVPGVVVDAFTPSADGSAGTGFLEGGARVSRACLLVGVHGANLAQMTFLRPGCWVVELGAADIFSDYYCLARNLGLRYWLSLGSAGAHGATDFTANVDELADILRAFAEAAPWPEAS